MKTPSTLRNHFRLVWVETILCLLAIMLTPAGSGQGFALAFTPVKFYLTAFSAMLVCLATLPLLSKKAYSLLEHTLSHPQQLFAALAISPILLILSLILPRTIWQLYQTTGIFSYRVLFTRSIPFFVLLGITALQKMVYLICLRKNQLRQILRENKKATRWFAGLGLLTLSAGLIVHFTRIGLIKDNAFFGKPTVPLLEFHLFLAYFTALFIFIITQKKTNWIRFLPLLIWGFAALIWLAIPNQHGFFSPTGRAPNFTPYPYSDGSFYGHYARSLAEGMGFKGDEIPPRPLYILILALFYRIAGANYNHVIILQTLLIAFLPVLIYQIGKELHSPSAGASAALLCILRETNAILSAPFAHNVSSTKYLFADSTAALTAALFLLLFIRWLKNNQNVDAALAGGALGMMALVRTQSLSLLLLPLGLVLFSSTLSWRKRILQLGLFGVMLCACLMPWLIRNYQITGKLVFDHPLTQTAEMANSYNLDKLDMSREPRMNDGMYTDKLTHIIRKSIQTHPKEIAHFILAHFSNNEMSNLRLFPLRDKIQNSHELWRPTEPFWEILPNDALSVWNIMWLSFYATILITGIAAITAQKKRAGIAPLIAIVLFNFSTAVGRYSAGRYLLPVDWILFLYFGIGTAAIITFFHELVVPHEEKPWIKSKERKQLQLWVAALLFPLIGLFLPLSARIIPNHFNPITQTEIAEKLELPTVEQERHPYLLHAIAIYPRYYPACDGEPESAKQSYTNSDYGRLIFLMLAPNGFGTAELPLSAPPDFFPDGAEVMLSGHWDRSVLQVERIIVKKDKTQKQLTGETIHRPCTE